MNGLGDAAHGFGPAEGFLDFLSALLRQGVARMLRGAPVDGGVAGPLCDVRCHHHPPERGDEVGAVVSLVCS
jgi:hypothetical protein